MIGYIVQCKSRWDYNSTDPAPFKKGEKVVGKIVAFTNDTITLDATDQIYCIPIRGFSIKKINSKQNLDFLYSILGTIANQKST